MKNRSKKEKRQNKLVISSFILGALVMLLVLKSISLLTSANIISTSSDRISLAPAVEKAYDATVFIETYTGSIKESTGSGFIYKKDKKYAYILTNEHVIEGDSVEIINSQDERAEGKLLGKDAYLDLAIIRIEKKYAHKVASLGNSKNSRIGDSIFTIGSPLGENYQGSVTSGIISGKNRMVQTTVSGVSDNTWLMSVLQIDAAINPGSSGGPLLNTNGDVIGIVTMKLIKEEIEAMSFAIPIEYALSNVDSLEKGKQIKWPEIGISMVNVSASTGYSDIVIPHDVKDGVIILSTKENSSAEEAKLKRGDIITKVNDVKVKNTAYLKYELFKYKIGEKVNITYLRDGKVKTVSVKLSSSNE